MGGRDVNERHQAGEMPDAFSDTDPMSVPDGSAAPATLPTIGVDEIFAPLPPIPWLVQALRLAPGAPVVLAGYGFSGKTLLAQEIALCVASGKPVFGLFTCRMGRALHLDFEQGQR